MRIFWKIHMGDFFRISIGGICVIEEEDVGCSIDVSPGSVW